MPYVECERCGLTVFSAAYRFNVEYCPNCGARLPRKPSVMDPERRHPPFPREGRPQRSSADRGDGRK